MNKRYHIIGSGTVQGGAALHTLDLEVVIRLAQKLAPDVPEGGKILIANQLRDMDIGDQLFVPNVGWCVCLRDST
jgi:hypothetical protein